MLVAKNLLIEMAVHSEEEVFDMNPVASVSTEATNNLEGEELRHYVYQTIQSASRELNCSISEDDIGVLIRHHCGFRPRKKAALLTLPYIVSANLVTAPWRKQVDKKGKLRKGRDRRPSGMISAPIMIDGVKYLCNITNKTNLQGRIALYALTLKDGNGNIVESEKMADPSNVPHSNSEQSANGNAHLDNVTTSHEPNPSFQGANVQQNTETNKNNDIKTENIRMNKKLIRLNESDLHRIIKESVNEVLNELGDSDRIHNYLGTISGYYEAQGNSDKANRAYNLSTRLQKNRNNGQLYDPNSEESASEYRRNSYAYTNGFDKGWDKGRHQMEEATADPRWWQKDGEFPDMKDDAYSRPKQQVKVSEEQLHQIVRESVEQALSEGFFDKFRRTANAGDAYKGLDGDYSYSKDNDRFYYHDKYGNKHDTGIGYGKGTVGTNWNPFSKHFWNGGDRQVTQSDANFAKMRLKHFNDGSWGGKSRQDIDYNGKRAYDKEQERKRQEAWREQQRRDEENNQRYRAERPHRIGNTTDQYGHIRAYFDDDAAYDAGLR